MLKKRVERLQELKLIYEDKVSKKILLELRSQISRSLEREKDRLKRGYLFHGLITQIQAVSILHAIELLETQGSFTLCSYIRRLEERKGSKSMKLLLQDSEWALLKKEVDKIRYCEHSKYGALKEQVVKQLEKQPESRILVFAQYRDTIEHLVEMLSKDGFSVERFVGQADKEGSEGMTQEQQRQALEGFNSGKWNILVSSSIGEEGLHVPDVELVIFYDAVPSEIRAIQRRGRTGRNRPGKVIILLAEGTLDFSYYYSSIMKEKRMRNIIAKGMPKVREPTLFDF